MLYLLHLKCFLSGQCDSLHNAWCPVKKTSGAYWNSSNHHREVNQTFPHLFPSQLPCQRQRKGVRNTFWLLDPQCLQLSARPYSRTNKCRQGSLWPTFPPSHRELCHCETATEFQLHKDDKRELRQPHAVWLTLTQQLLPWHPCPLPGSLRCARLQLLQGAEVQLSRAAWHQPTHLPSVSSSFPSWTAWKTIPNLLHWGFLHTLSAFEDLLQCWDHCCLPAAWHGNDCALTLMPNQLLKEERFGLCQVGLRRNSLPWEQ